MNTTWIVASFLTVVPVKMYVAGDVVNVRERPDGDAPVVARLRINAEVEEDAASDVEGWVRVRFDPGSDPISGYIREELLSKAPLDLAQSLSQADVARARGDQAGAIQWAERAVAIEPTPGAVGLLRGLYLSAGLFQKVHAVADLATGRQDVLLAICTRKPTNDVYPAHANYRVVLLAVLGPSGPRAAEPWLDDSASAAAWFELAPDGTASPVTDSRFAAPKEVLAFNESADANATPYTDDRLLVLGPCKTPGTLYATAPLAQVDTPPLPPAQAAHLARSVLRTAREDAIERGTKVEIERVLAHEAIRVPGTSLVASTARMAARRPPANEAEWSEGVAAPDRKLDAILPLWALFRKGQSRPEALVNMTGAVRWVALPRTGARVALVDAGSYSEYISEDGVRLVWIGPSSQVIQLEVTLSGEGC